ncbi:hypothetical protein UlMin_015529 [Ulmus minor]
MLYMYNTLYFHLSSSLDSLRLVQPYWRQPPPSPVDIACLLLCLPHRAAPPSRLARPRKQRAKTAATNSGMHGRHAHLQWCSGSGSSCFLEPIKQYLEPIKQCLEPLETNQISIFGLGSSSPSNGNDNNSLLIVGLQAAPKAHLVSSDPRRIQVDVEQAQDLVRKLDSEKRIEENILCGSDNDKMSREKSHAGSTGPVIIVWSLMSVKGLEGVELLDTLITYLWCIHGLDYYGMIEKRKSFDIASNGEEWEKKLDSHWQERLQSQDPTEVLTAKEKIDAAAAEALDPHVRKIRDEKYGWNSSMLAEFVRKHLKLKHPELVMELTVKVREELYFQNYMNDADAPGGTPVMQQSGLRDGLQTRRFGADARLKDDCGNRRDRDNLASGSERFNNLQPCEFQSNNDGLRVGPPFPSDISTPPILMPVPGAGPLGPFVPAPPEVAMRMSREQGGPPPFEVGGRNSRSEPQLSGPAPMLALSPALQQDPRRLRSYQDLDAPEDEVTVIDYRSL